MHNLIVPNSQLDMNKVFSYLPYLGVNSFAYFGCTKDDEAIASDIADTLISKGFRLYLDARGDKNEASALELSKSIDACEGAIVFLSKKSIESLAFRNIINNIVSIKKPVIFVKIGEFDLAYGLDMQLANMKVISYTNKTETANALLDSGILTQDMIGEGMEERVSNNKKYIIMVIMIIISILILVISAIGIVNKRTSVEYRLKDVNNMDYLNISSYGEDAISVLKGKYFGELDLSGGKFTSLDGIEDINIKVINISDISEDISLLPLENIKGLEKVKISQNQINLIDRLYDLGIKVVITH